ncbi:LysM peptidoglycan-binding domain-containing protein [Ferrimonas balearica]|uniref:LysM peptidoglycan-binding domain-containing protein n=1 Tax=Ferrimonas balearica TaxID=44012 RepID=UPI001C5B703B|nr:LysM peptidoglycan-binding domain-containing protein [Ferrimonas balearica]MBY6019940.1 LysM peptidoglycan-binding domain-containing protein [Halomonas denitrificans]MBW3166711.1 LysM peptidoglycan-binding domain-containing protein [Ferrimonas balearica]MBY5982413.1 LysM peptidoglycan-binding domain-containing protein [Ferrimonas balearica]MBY6096971.1 LysM peptidoglycan-binding domain-containing protein [Ferrimonas balearica]MBY6108763.1 LysM peptidoglycan-binding domain-containing protein
MRIAIIMLAALLSLPLAADTLTLKPGHPQTYVVKKGDTLWDISALFLDDPWRWPTLWGANPQIANPHLIYPGDRLNLVYLDGQPRLVRKPMKRMSPQMDVQQKGGAIPALPLSVIEPYLSFQQILGEKALADTPQVIGGERDAVRYAKGDVVFINERLPLGEKFGIYMLARRFVDPDTKEFLGQEALMTATGRVIESGTVSRIELLSMRQEVKTGHRVMALEDDLLLPAYMMPTAAPHGADGRVIASDAMVREIGPLEVAIINRGSEDGAAAGQVYAISKEGTEVVEQGNGEFVQPEDRRAYDEMVATLSDGRTIKQPEVYRGELMLFKTYDRVSLGLIVNGRHPVRLLDVLSRPEPLVFGSDSD